MQDDKREQTEDTDQIDRTDELTPPKQEPPDAVDGNDDYLVDLFCERVAQILARRRRKAS